jgi:hypothetical protein
MSDDLYATRREFDLLRSDLIDNKRAVDELKSSNAAIAVLGTQMTSLAQSMAEIKTDIASRFTAHDTVHRNDAESRINGRRWMVGAAIAAIGALIGLYGWIALFIHR